MSAEHHIETAVVSAEEAGDRLDRVLAAILPACRARASKRWCWRETSRSRARRSAIPGIASARTTHISVAVPAPEPAKPAGEAIALDILYEDDAMIVINKPRGLVVHPAAGHASGTLVNALIAHCGDSLSGIGGERRPGIVHRLDKDTTGVMVAAKTDRAHRALAAQFADHGRNGPLQRGYLAFVWGAPRDPKGTIDKPIDRHPTSREKMAVRAGGREAITHWRVLEKYLDARGNPIASMVECRLETGRTHQIRVHLASIGHPLIGDDVYGPGFRTKTALLGPAAKLAVDTLGRQALHAYLLGVEHPGNKRVFGISCSPAARPWCFAPGAHGNSRGTWRKNG